MKVVEAFSYLYVIGRIKEVFPAFNIDDLFKNKPN